MIYLVYPLLLFALFAGCKISKKGQWNEEAFSLGQMKALQGFIAVCIMLHHCGQKTSASWIEQETYVPGLEFFVPIGFVLVSFFTFCSGYGLYKSFKTKKDYLKDGFLRKRILPVIVVSYFISLIFFAVRLMLGEDMSGGTALWYLLRFKLCNPNEWFALIIPFFYLAFYLAYRFIKNENAALIAVFAFTVCYQLFGTTLDHNDWWLCGEWWYNSVHLFPVGILFAKHEDKIVDHLKKHFVLYMVLGIIAILVSGIAVTYTAGVVSYYGEYWGAPDKVLRRIICLSAEMFKSSSVVFVAFLMGLKIRIGNPFLKLMGKITLEFYLIHGLFVEIFCHSLNSKVGTLFYIRNSALFVLVVFALGLPCAIAISKLMGLLPVGKRTSLQKPTDTSADK